MLTPGRVLSAALLWLALGSLGLLALTDRGPVVARVVGGVALVVPAIPVYLLATRFETTTGSHERGALWASVHGPPFLTPRGVAVVYFLPASIALLCLLAWWVIEKHS